MKKPKLMKKTAPYLGLFIGLALLTTGFAPAAFAQTTGTSTDPGGSGGTTSTTTGTTTGGTSTSTTATSTTATTTTSGSGTTTATTTTGGTGTTTGTTTATTTTGGTGTTTGTTTATTTSGQSATTTNTATTTGTTSPVTVQIMNHLCNANIKNASDFIAVQQGLGAVAAFAAAEYNCPTTALPGHVQPASSTVYSPRTNFDFMVMGPNNVSYGISNATFISNTVCETDANVDFNKDNTIATSTCLDASYYRYPMTATSSSATSTITVNQSTLPAGYHFGALMFTPSQINNNNDAASFASLSSNATTGQGTIVLNAAPDTDRVVTLHIFNFLHQTGTTTGTTTATTTTGGGTGTTTGTTTATTTTGGGGTGTTTATTTTGTTTATTTDSMQLAIVKINAIVNLIQRVQDIQARILDIIDDIANIR